MNHPSTQVIDLNRENYDPSLLNDVASAIEEGKLVGIPTETVYGIAAREDDPDTISRLLEIRNSPKDKKMSIHIGKKNDFQKYCPDPPPMACRLASRFWPGPLTLVLPHESRETVGLRMPGNRITLDLLRKVDAPVVAPSANLSGEPPATQADQVLDTFQGKLAYVLNGGESTYGVSSTVVKVESDNQWSMLREGVIETALIEEESAKHLLFVCTGNTCRSPMATVICRNLLKELGKQHNSDELLNEYQINSAGTAAGNGIAVSPQANQVVQNRYNESLNQHMSKGMTPSLAMESDHIFVMTPSHRESIVSWIPEVEDRITVLKSAQGGIADPVGADVETYKQCADQIHDALQPILESIVQNH